MRVQNGRRPAQPATGAGVPTTSALRRDRPHGVRGRRVPVKVHEGVCPTEQVTVP